MADDVVINIRTRGGRQSAREADAAAAGLTRLSRAASVAGSGVQSLAKSSASGASRGLRLMGNQAQYAGLAIGGIGALSVRAGLQFNASMESNRIAFAQFLGSTQAANRELSTLYTVAKNTPFEFPQLTSAARRFLAFGFSVDKANSLLNTVGDTVAGIGGGADELDRIVTALGQMRAKGRVQTEELMQLQELGLPVNDILRKKLGLTAKQIGNIGNENISAAKAINALQQGFDDTFGGASAKQAKTFNGQMSTLHDNINQTLGAITAPGFRTLENTVLPQLNTAATKVNDIFSRTDLTTGQKFTASRKAFDPLVDQAKTAIREAHIGAVVEHQFEVGMTRLADTAAREAPHVAKAFGEAWLNSGPWAKFLSLALIGVKTGAIGKILGGGGLFGGRGSPKNPAFVVPIGGGGMPGGPGGKGGKGPLRKWGTRLGPIAGSTAARAGGAGAAFVYGSGLAGGRFGSSAGLSPDEEHARLSIPGNVVPRGVDEATYLRRQRALGNARRNDPAAFAPAKRGSHTMVAVVNLNGREIARAVADEASNARARRGR